MILRGAAMDSIFIRRTFPLSFSSCLSQQSSSPLNSFSALGVLVRWVIPARAGSNLGWPGSWLVVKLVWGPKANLRIAGETDLHWQSWVKRDASVRAVRSSYVTLRCTHALSLAGLCVCACIIGLSEPMNAIILAQVELNQNSIHCFSFPTHPTLRADLPWRCPPR